MTPGEEWFGEPPIGGYQQRYKVNTHLHHEQTSLQDLRVVELQAFGRALILDGTLQTSVADEFTYHEMLVHVPLFAHPRPRTVLIIGGGDGGTARHVFMHSGIERAVQVEIDGGVVSACKRLMPGLNGTAYADPRLELHIADGASYVRDTSDRFDVILVDSTDAVGPAAVLLQASFLQAAHLTLARGGLMVMQSGSPLTQPREFSATIRAFRAAFTITRPYTGWVPIYPGVVWSWVIGSDELDPATIDDITVSHRMEQLREQPRVYNPQLHRAAFALPTFARKLADHDREPSYADLQSFGHPIPGVIPAN